YRERIGPIDGAHPRHVEAIAELMAAYSLFLDWAETRGLIDAATGEARMAAAQADLVELGKAQASKQAESKISRKFLEYLVSALRAGDCHLANGEPKAGRPEDEGRPGGGLEEACGWRYDGVAGDRYAYRVPTGSRRIGWVNVTEGLVYLDPEQSKAV